MRGAQRRRRTQSTLKIGGRCAPPAPAPLITYTKYLRRASSRSRCANNSHPLAIAIPLRLSVIKPSPRLDSLGGPAPGGLRRGAGRGTAAGGSATGRVVCRRPSTVQRRARVPTQPRTTKLKPTTQL